VGEELDNDEKNAKKSALATLEAGKRAVEDAEAELERVLSELRVAPRAEKTAVSAAIESALSRVRTARASVVDAERMLADEAR
jgi:hypothetical protein